MDINQVGTFVANEIAGFGIRWLIILIFILLSGGFFHKRYKNLESRVGALEEAVPRDRGATFIQGGVHIASSPPDLGDVNEIRCLTQSEYDALPTKKEKTLYLIAK